MVGNDVLLSLFYLLRLRIAVEKLIDFSPRRALATATSGSMRGRGSASIAKADSGVMGTRPASRALMVARVTPRRLASLSWVRPSASRAALYLSAVILFQPAVGGEVAGFLDDLNHAIGSELAHRRQDRLFADFGKSVDHRGSVKDFTDLDIPIHPTGNGGGRSGAWRWNAELGFVADPFARLKIHGSGFYWLGEKFGQLGNGHVPAVDLVDRVATGFVVSGEGAGFVNGAAPLKHAIWEIAEDGAFVEGGECFADGFDGGHGLGWFGVGVGRFQWRRGEGKAALHQRQELSVKYFYTPFLRLNKEL